MFETDKVFTIRTLNMCESIGYFCIIRTDSSNALYWDSCREIFAKNFNYNSYGFYYVVDIKKVDYILSFLIEAEKVLNLKEFTKFYRTNKESIIAIIPSSFWMKCFLRRSFFTLLCRVAFFHNKDSTFEETLFSDVDCKVESKIDSNKKDVVKTKSAVLRFFLGYTKFSGAVLATPELGPWKHGWVEEFLNKTDSQIKRLLVAENMSLANILFSD